MKDLRDLKDDTGCTTYDEHTTGRNNSLHDSPDHHFPHEVINTNIIKRIFRGLV